MATKPAAKAPSNKRALFSKLNQLVKKDAFSKAIAITNQLLALLPADKDVLKTKTICLIHCGKLEEALSVAKEAALQFEACYCMYKLQMFQEALEAVKGDDPRLRHIEAQVRFRMGEFDKAVALYDEMARDPRFGETPELATNRLAALIALGKRNASLTAIHSSKIRPDDSYEFCFNTACALVEAGDLDQAQQYLDRAEQLGKETLETDGLDEATIDDSLCAIRTQRAFLLQKLGDDATAEDIYTAVLKTRPSDKATVGSAANNLAILLRKRDVLGSLKRLKLASGPDVWSKLLPAQQKTVWLNHALVLRHIGKSAEVEALLGKITQQWPSWHVPVVFRAYLLGEKGNDVASAAGLIQGFLKSDTVSAEAKLEARLALSRMYVSQNNVADAVNVLLADEELKNRPKALSTVVRLLSSNDRYEQALDVLNESIAQWGKDDCDSSRTISGVLRLIKSRLLLKISRSSEAVEVLQPLVNGELLLEPVLRIQAIAAMVEASCFCDVAAGEEVSEQLPGLPPCEGVDESDLDALFAVAGMVASKKSPGPVKAEAAVEVSKDSGGTVQDSLTIKRKQRNTEKIKRRREKRRLAYLKKLEEKGMLDGSVVSKPDPERWIPRRFRTAGRKKGRSRRLQLVGGAQGFSTSAAETDKLDATKMASSDKAKASTAQVSSAKSTKRNVHKKKKGRRRK